MDDILLQSIVKTVEGQEEQIKQMQKEIAGATGHTEQLQTLVNDIGEIKSGIKRIAFPTTEMQKLTETLDKSLHLLRQPVQTKVEHHHHFGKLLLVTCGLFIVLCLLAAGWLMTSKSLSRYKTNDTKYRYLKLYHNQSLRQLLRATDSMHHVMPHLRDSVLWQEDINQERFEIQQRIREKQNEIDQLKDKVK